jgi:transposase
MVLVNPFKLKILLYPQRIDMRLSWSGLVSIVEESLKLNPYDRSLYVFLGNNRKRVKILYWDGNGFCIWMKRLDAGIFPFATNGKLEISKQELIWILSGVDIRKKHKEIIIS